MTHEEGRTLLAAAAVDSLEADEMSSLRDHLAGCLACAEELETLQRVAALLPFATPLEPVDAAVQQRIRARLAARVIGER